MLPTHFVTSERDKMFLYVFDCGEKPQVVEGKFNKAQNIIKLSFEKECIITYREDGCCKSATKIYKFLVTQSREDFILYSSLVVELWEGYQHNFLPF